MKLTVFDFVKRLLITYLLLFVPAIIAHSPSCAVMVWKARYVLHWRSTIPMKKSTGWSVLLNRFREVNAFNN